MALRQGAGAMLVGLGGAATYRYQKVKARESQLPQRPLTVFDSKTKRTIDNDKQKRVIIIGAGVVGVSTAYKLAKLGHQVVVLVSRLALRISYFSF